MAQFFSTKENNEFMIKSKDIIKTFEKKYGINLEKLYKSILNILKKLDDSTLIKLETNINDPNIKGGKKRKTRKSKRKTRKSKRKTRKYGGNKNKSKIIVPDDDHHVIDIQPINENDEEQTCCICLGIMRGINNSNNNSNNNDNDNNNNNDNNNDNNDNDNNDDDNNDNDGNNNEQLQSLETYKHTYEDNGIQYSHYVHEVCLNELIESLTAQRLPITCPICRNELPQEDVDNILNKYRDNNTRPCSFIKVLLAIIYLILYCIPTLSGMALIVLLIYSNQPTGGSNIMEKEQQQKNLLKLLEILNELIKHKGTSDTSEIKKLIDLIKQKITQN
jgi:hypothetical protein